MTILIVARHGNTFEEGEPPRRVGRRTDLPLTATGEDQAWRLGQLLKSTGLSPTQVFTGTLERTRKTAAIASQCPAQTRPGLDEIDYGPDENKTEDKVVARLGAALVAWETDAVVPPGWLVDPEAVVKVWQDIATEVKDSGGIALAVTSNGIARFAPAITGDFASFRQKYALKLATGAYGVLRHGPQGWAVDGWNIRP